MTLNRIQRKLTETLSHRGVMALAMVLGVCGLQNDDAAAAEWTIAPYLWAPDVTMDVKVNGDPARSSSPSV